VLTTKALLPGEIEVVSVVYPVGGAGDLTFSVIVDADANGASTENECLEDNNDAEVAGVNCPGLN
jgi:hypothetical protein